MLTGSIIEAVREENSGPPAWPPTYGRFLQPDPIGYQDSPNLYNYVLGDPVNNVDPLGTRVVWVQQKVCVGVGSGPMSCGYRWEPSWEPDPVGSDVGLHGPALGGGGGGGEIVITAKKPRTPQQKRTSQNTCQVAAQEPGKIAYAGVGGTIADIFGVTGGFGKFVNLQTGTTGYYVTGGTAVGEEAAATGGGGIASSMSAFTGFSVNLTGAGGGVSGTVSINTSGHTESMSGAWGAGAAATLSYTGIFGCKLGG